MTVCGIKHADGVCVMGKCPYVKMCCPAVWDKSGKVEMTNEEWFTSLSTEEKADKLTDFSFWLVPTIPTDEKREQIKQKIVEWLKEIHK